MDIILAAESVELPTDSKNPDTTKLGQDSEAGFQVVVTADALYHNTPIPVMERLVWCISPEPLTEVQLKLSFARPR